jgi:transposase
MPRKLDRTAEERVEVVLTLLRREETAAALARRFQVSEATVYRWREAFLAGGKAAVAQPTSPVDSASERRIQQLERELAQRTQIIGELSIANDILKKIQSRP